MYRVKSYSGIKAVNKELSTIEMYVAIFNNIDSDKEMIMPGAFSKTIAERGPESSQPRIKHLWQHSRWEPIGIPLSMGEDATGLKVESKFGTDTFSQDKLLQHIDKIITEFSIGFNVIKSEEVMDADGKFEFRKLTELKLWEYSSVTWGANKLTHITDIKGETKEDRLKRLNDRMDRLFKALRDVKYTDESKEVFEIEYLQIQETINSLLKEPEQSTLKPEQSTSIKSDDIINILKQINI